MVKHLLSVPSGFRWKPLFAFLLFFNGIQAAYSQADYAIQGAAVSPTAVAAGGSIYASSSIYNLGNTSGASSNIGYYLSTNSTLEDSDTFIGSTSGSSLNAGGSSSRYATLIIPANTATGSYYLLFKADYLNNVSESNENNNVSSVAISVVPSAVDFVISYSSMYTASLSAGTSFSVEGNVSNRGNISSSPNNVGFYLSTNSTLDGTDVFIGSYNSTYGIAPNDYAYFSAYLTVPANTAPGSYHVIMVADYLNSVAESNELNNTASRPLTVVSPSIDLVVQSPYLYNSSVTPGNYVSAQFSVYNQGNTTANSSNVGYYLSTNSTFDAADTFIGSYTGSSLGGSGYSGTRSANITIPSNTAIGSYYILFVVDYLNSVSETNETNNASGVALSVIAPNVDLSLQSAAVSSSTISAGNPLTVTSTVYNLGNTTASSSNIGYYLSTDNTLDAADVFISFVNGGAISIDYYNYNTRSASVTIPANTTPGNYYLIQKVDYLNAITESNESNNVASSYISITAQGTTFITPASGTSTFTTCTGKLYDQGGTGNYADNVHGSITLNPGIAGNKIRLSFISFSLESCCDYVEIFDGTSTSAPSLGRFAYASPGVITASNAAGALTLVFHTDGSATYSGFEADISCVTPSFDLSILSGYANVSSLTPGTSFTATSFIANTGTTSSPSSNVGFYLSANSTFEATDLYLGATTNGGILTSSNSAQRTHTLTLPTSVTGGNYNLIFVADPTHQVEETNENNNARASAISVTSSNVIDLAITERTLALTSVLSGTTVNATATVSNSGNTVSPRNAVGFYLSTNTTLDEGDVFLTSNQTAGTLAAGATEVVSASLAIPSTAVAGSYYILFVPDPENHIAESSETNGILSLALTVTNNSTDLIVQNAGLSPTSLIAGGTVTATSSIRNQGSVAATSSDIGYYLSSNPTFEASDVALTTTSGGSLAGTTAAEKSATLTIPAGTAAGSYYVLFVADPANGVTEGNEANNVSSIAFTVLPQTVDLVIQTPALSGTSLTAGGSVTATATIRNSGTVASSASNVGYYLSTNTTFDASDVAVGTSTGGELAASASAEKMASITIPATTAAGNYYVLFVADPAGGVTESIETNNVSSVALTVNALPSPDLIVETFYTSPSSTFIKGAGFTVASIIKNQGNAISSASSFGVYLSYDETWDAADVLLAEATGSALNPNATTTLTATVTIPSTTLAGFYRLIVKADHRNAVTESNEDNNIRFTGATIANPTVDLFVNNVVASTSILSVGSSLTISTRISNSGNSSAASSNVGFYLSANNVFDANDIALGTVAGEALAPGANATRSGTFTVAANTPDGAYYLLTVADPGNAVTETNETNNVVDYIGFFVYPQGVDLLMRNTMLSSAFAVKGSNINVSSSILNSRTLPASSSNVGYYLSGNSTYDENDVLLGTSTGGILAAGASETKNATITIPATTAAGNYFILFIADPSNEVVESSETNNISAVTFTVYESNTSVQKPDLMVQAPTIDNTIVRIGDKITITSRVLNIGNTTAPAGKVSYFVSSDDEYEVADFLVVESSFTSLAAGASVNSTTTYTIPSWMGYDQFHLIAKVDHNGPIDEIDETNNVSTATLLRMKDPNGIKELSDEHKLTLWPNPAVDKLSVEAEGFRNGEKTAEITVYSVTGQKVIRQKAAIANQKLKASLDVASLNHGLYLVYIQVGDTLTIRRVAIQK